LTGPAERVRAEGDGKEEDRRHRIAHVLERPLPCAAERQVRAARNQGGVGLAIDVATLIALLGFRCPRFAF